MPKQDMNVKDVVFALPDIAKLLWRVVRDERVPTGVRAGLVGTAVSLAVPWDPIPDWIPVDGQLDDLVVITVGGRALLRRISESIVREHWDGSDDTLEMIHRRNGGRPALPSPNGG